MIGTPVRSLRTTVYTADYMTINFLQKAKITEIIISCLAHVLSNIIEDEEFMAYTAANQGQINVSYITVTKTH